MRGNNVAKHMNKFNKSQVFIDRKKEMKRCKKAKHKHKYLDNYD